MRYYLVPKIGAGVGGDRFRPKYTDLDSLEPGWDIRPWTAMDYGPESAFLLAADPTPAQHTLLNAQPDVLAVPADLTTTVSAGALATVQGALEDLNLPGQWVTTSHTYRQVLKAVVRMIRFMQRWNGLHGALRLFGAGVTLSATINDLTPIQRTRLQAVADAFDLDTSGVTGAMTIRQALKTIADQLGDVPFGGDTF